MMQNNKHIPKGYKDSPLGVIPQEWQVKEFGVIASRVKDRYNPSNNNNVKCLELEHFEQDMGVINGWVNAAELKSIKNVFNKGDILFSKLRPYLKKYWIAEFQGVCSSEIWVLQANTKICLNNYLYRIIQTHRFIQIANVSSGSKMPRADWEYVSMMPMLLPPLEEQRRIAEVLGCWDEAIEWQGRMVTLLTTRKRAIMQRLLTPQPHWQKTKLGEICSITTGKIDANAMVDNGAYPFFTCAKEAYRIDKFFFDTEALLVAGNGEHLGYVHYYSGKFNAYQRTYVLDNFKQWIHFMKYLLIKQLPKRIIETKSSSNTPYIVLSTLSELQINIPPLAEQKSIAEKLSTADAEIDLALRRLDLLRTQKRALMQQLLTGKKQLKS